MPTGLELRLTSQVNMRFEPPQPGTRSNRSKYECPGCQAHVWGKPGVGITCNTCELGFEEV